MTLPDGQLKSDLIAQALRAKAGGRPGGGVVIDDEPPPERSLTAVQLLLIAAIIGALFGIGASLAVLLT